MGIVQLSWCVLYMFIFYGILMDKASRRKQATRAKKLQNVELESYRQFFPHGVDELSISTTG